MLHVHVHVLGVLQIQPSDTSIMSAAASSSSSSSVVVVPFPLSVEFDASDSQCCCVCAEAFRTEAPKDAAADRRPRTLTCGHSLCTDCTQKLLDGQERSDEAQRTPARSDSCSLANSAPSPLMLCHVCCIVGCACMCAVDAAALSVAAHSMSYLSPTSRSSDCCDM